MAHIQWFLTSPLDGHMLNQTNITNAIICPVNVTDPMNSGWVFTVFGECVTNLRQWFAFWIGLSSILFWLVAQVPQLVTNCRTGKADQALSFWFLLQWFLGDATNLAGAVLARQLATQIVTAVYFVLIDTVTLIQFFFYVIKNQGIKGLLSCFKLKKPKAESLAAILPGLMFTALMVSTNPILWARQDPYQVGSRSGRTLKHIDFKNVIDINDPRDVAGYVLGCISAIFYVMSRVPQIVKNCRRCSVEGLSPIMFVLAILGNVTYGLGIFLYSVEPVFLLQRLPWLVGSVGTLFFDFTIVVQFLISLCSKHGAKKYLSGERGVDREPLLDPASSDGGDLPCFKKRKRKSIEDTSIQRTSLSRSRSPEAVKARYESVQ